MIQSNVVAGLVGNCLSSTVRPLLAPTIAASPQLPGSSTSEAAPDMCEYNARALSSIAGVTQ